MIERRRAVRVVLAAWLALATLPAAAFDGIVTRVSDGDTLWVRPFADGEARGKPRKLRVQGIDAPERCQRWGPEATAHLQALVLGQPVRALEGPVDDHGRRLVRLMLRETDVGAWMVSEGHAWSHRYRGDLGPYAAEERAARLAQRGLFADRDAEQPREFRRRHGPCN